MLEDKVAFVTDGSGHISSGYISSGHINCQAIFVGGGIQ
jgi:hypothetical protein